MEDGNEPKKPKSERIGYGNPPEHTRFKAGHSGNAGGRPKGSLNMATVLQRALREKVIIFENGRPKTISILEAAFRQLTKKAVVGDLKAIQLLTNLARSLEEPTIGAATQSSGLDEADEKVALSILKRYEAANRGDQKNAEEPDGQ